MATIARAALLSPFSTALVNFDHHVSSRNGPSLANIILTDPLRATPYTRLPYKPGRELQLQICESHRPDLQPSERLTATIHKMMSMTMSPVLDVTISVSEGTDIRAVLKLYDRRFGKDLRIGQRYAAPHMPVNEAMFQDFVRRGMMAPFFRELEEEKKAELLPSRPGHFLDSTLESQGKFEAALWHECSDHFACETKAYERLRDLQGKLIPDMLAHVRVVPFDSDALSIPPDLQHMASYFEVKGVLLGLIEGYSLEDIATSPLGPSDKAQWQPIIQAAAGAAHEINKRGVLMNDASPRNVVVDRRSQTPFIVDLAQCHFKDDLAELWHEMEWDKEEEYWDPDVQYWERASSDQNPAAIGLVAASRVRKMGVTVDLAFPDYDGIIANITAIKGLTVPIGEDSQLGRDR